MSGPRFFIDVLTSRIVLRVPPELDPLENMEPVKVLRCPVAALDGFDGAASMHAVANSVVRYLEEYFPSKAELKSHVRSYARELLARRAALGKNSFQPLLELMTRVVAEFEVWRFYCAAGSVDATDPNAPTPLPVMRVDVGQTAELHFWGAGLMRGSDPRERVLGVSDLQLLRKVGEGHPSEVWEAEVAGGQRVAAKRLKEWARTAGGSLTSERDWLCALDHPHILAYRGVVIEGDAVQWILTELMSGQRLSDMCRAGALPPPDALRLGIDVARGLQALHERSPPVMHRDLHSDNLLLAHDGRVVRNPTPPLLHPTFPPSHPPSHRPMILSSHHPTPPSHYPRT